MRPELNGEYTPQSKQLTNFTFQAWLVAAPAYSFGATSCDSSSSAAYPCTGPSCTGVDSFAPGASSSSPATPSCGHHASCVHFPSWLHHRSTPSFPAPTYRSSCSFHFASYSNAPEGASAVVGDLGSAEFSPFVPASSGRFLAPEPSAYRTRQYSAFVAASGSLEIARLLTPRWGKAKQRG